MNEKENLYRILLSEKQRIMLELEDMERELSRTDKEQKSIVIKKIKDRLYYYSQWQEEGRVCGKYLGPVRPGAVSELENELQEKQKAQEKKRECQESLKRIEEMLEKLERDRRKQKILETYSFEVFWKDEITARVYVKEKQVLVARYTEHPLKQLFAQKKMTRYQLNRILELRCWERGRADIADLLKGLGLKEYSPVEIVRKTHGTSYNDYIWFRFPGENLTGRDVLARYQ